VCKRAGLDKRTRAIAVVIKNVAMDSPDAYLLSPAFGTAPIPRPFKCAVSM
jgi:hypothetical protein